MGQDRGGDQRGVACARRSHRVSFQHVRPAIAILKPFGRQPIKTVDRFLPRRRAAFDFMQCLRKMIETDAQASAGHHVSLEALCNAAS